MVNEILDQKAIDEGKCVIAGLVRKFENGKDNYMSVDTKEEDIKVEFITPMFKALGWDVDNEQDNSVQFKEVIFEETIKVGKKTKNPDYTFQIGGTKIFYVEAKAPHVDIDRNRNPAYQVRRYGFSTEGMNLSVLTDFEEFAIYETNTRPNKNQAPSIGRVKYYKYTDYEDNWEEIYSILSKDAVMKGLTEKFVEGTEGIITGTSSLDKEFLKEINSWREDLARNIALRNPELSEESLNYAVQLIIDRILFFRMAEDRGIERYQTLLDLTKKDNIYENLMELFKIADKKYNSGLFCLSADPSKHVNRDTITEGLIIDDGIFKKIFKNLYYPDSPYEFSVISPDILGVVYEQFLGSVITLTDGHRARIEEKAAVRKAGGVFYTPQPIVKDIIENTVGKLIKDKKLKEIDEIKIIDIACGSGSFILGAYKYLLNHYLNEYLKMKNAPPNTIYQGKDGKWRLTISEKKRILKNNIYGVDIDFLAVEVSKLTLLLQVLEDQNKDVVEQQQTLYHERVLPDLSDNIKNGNSIIETDYINVNTKYDEIKVINPFNYREQFPEVFENGGFDAIITNPPYVRKELISKNEKDYFKEHYKVYNGNADYYVYFYERAFQILKDNGYFGLICSNKFTRASYGKNLRKYLLNYRFDSYKDFTGEKVFKDATVDPSVMVFNKSVKKDNKIFVDKEFYLSQSNFTEDVWIFETPEIYELKEKILSKGTPLGELNVEINRGVTSGLNKAFIIDEKTRTELINEDSNSAELIKPILKGRDITTNYFEFKNNYILYITWDCKINKYPAIKNHLSKFKSDLSDRTEVKNKRYKWYCLSRYNAKAYDNFYSPKLIWAEISQKPAFCVDLENHMLSNSAYILNSYDDNYPLYYLVGLLNSNLTNWIFRRISSILSTSMRFTNQYVSRIPIVDADDDIKKEVMEMSKNLIGYYKQFNSDNTSPNQKNILDKQIKTTEDTLNKIVYDLYELSDEEIKIIEGNVESED